MYTYDVFISYKRDSINEQWLDDIFLPLFKSYLNNSLPEPPKIFVDRTNIIDGTEWTKTIEFQLAHSKCMVAILSPAYFFKRSEWCIREFISMKHREEILDLRPNNQPPGLIWPLMLQPINSKSEILHSIQMKDYSDYNRIGEGFKKNESYFHFQTKLRQDSNIIVSIIENAPNWKPEWDTPEWKNAIEEKVKRFLDDNIDPKQNLTSW